MQTKNRCCLLDRCNAVSEIFGCNGFKVELVIGREFPENFQIDLFGFLLGSSLRIPPVTGCCTSRRYESA